MSDYSSSGRSGNKVVKEQRCFTLNFYYDIVRCYVRGSGEKQESKQDALKGEENSYRCHSARQLNDNNWCLLSA